MSKQFRPTGFMIDLEFADNKESSAIMQIAIVPVNTVDATYEKDKSKCLFIHVDPDDCVKHGMTIGIDTIKWWINQDHKVLKNAFDLDSIEFKHPLDVALVKVTNFVTQFFGKDDKSMEVYQRGDKDSAILNYAYQKVFRHGTPWHFYNVNCMRILSSVFPNFDTGVYANNHNALSDAMNQAEALCKYLEHARSLESGKKPKPQPVKEVVPEDDEL